MVKERFLVVPALSFLALAVHYITLIGSFHPGRSGVVLLLRLAFVFALAFASGFIPCQWFS